MTRAIDAGDVVANGVQLFGGPRDGHRIPTSTWTAHRQRFTSEGETHGYYERRYTGLDVPYFVWIDETAEFTEEELTRLVSPFLASPSA